jgi:hypothetical protein
MLRYATPTAPIRPPLLFVSSCDGDGGGEGLVVVLHVVSVGEPHGVGDDLVPIVVAVPGVGGVRAILDVEHGVSEAVLPEGRVRRLRPGELVGEPLDVPAVPDGDVHRRAAVRDRRALAVGDVVLDVGEAMAALVRVDVAGEDDVDTRVDGYLLELHAHGLAFHVVEVVAVVPGRVRRDEEPWGHRAIHALELRLQPLELRRVLAERGVGRQHDDVRGPQLDGVPTGLRRVAGSVRRRIAVGEGLEGLRLAELRRVVDLVVAGGPDPGLVGHAALGEAAPRVPPVVVVERVLVGVGEVAHEDDGVAGVLLVVRHRAVGVCRLSQVADEPEPERNVRPRPRRRREPERPNRVATGTDGVVVLGGVLQVLERGVVDEAGGVVVVGVARVAPLGDEFEVVGVAAVPDGAVGDVDGDPGHGHGRPRLVAQRDVHLLRRVLPRRQREHVRVQRHVLGRLQLPPVRARDTPLPTRRGLTHDEERCQ